MAGLNLPQDYGREPHLTVDLLRKVEPIRRALDTDKGAIAEGALRMMAPGEPWEVPLLALGAGAKAVKPALVSSGLLAGMSEAEGGPLSKAAKGVAAGLRAGKGASKAVLPGERAAQSEMDARLLKSAGYSAPTEGPLADQIAAALRSPRQMLTEAIPAKAQRSSYMTSPTVANPQRVSFPDIYLRPDELVSRAKVAPEDPAMKQLFGVTRDDLYQIAEEGRRKGNVTERPFKAGEKARGAAVAEQITTKRNEQRLLDIIDEARQRPDLFKGMASWYTMDPLLDRFKQLYGPEQGLLEYERFNNLTGMASPGSEVLTEFNRGTAANWLDKEGRFEDFLTYGGGTRSGAPEDMSAVMGHPYHMTAQGTPMSRYLRSGELEMGSAKVPSYIRASGTPETGFQTQWPVGDAHWSRLVGLPDVRTAGSSATRNASATVPEMLSLGPWWRDKVAAKADLESVPAQAVVWGAGSNATGVTSPIGAPKLELLSQQIMETSRRLGVSPEKARDMVLTGKTHAGLATPEMLATLAGVSGTGAAIAAALRDEQQ